jgi:hypothetical protein
MNTVAIQPVSIWSPTGIQVANTFEVRYVNFNGVTAVADCHLWTAETGGVELQSSLVNATEEQCATWGTDNQPFYCELAENAGLTPIVPNEKKA